MSALRDTKIQAPTDEAMDAAQFQVSNFCARRRYAMGGLIGVFSSIVRSMILVVVGKEADPLDNGVIRSEMAPDDNGRIEVVLF